jgi:hypothetical protein
MELYRPVRRTPAHRAACMSDIHAALARAAHSPHVWTSPQATCLGLTRAALLGFDAGGPAWIDAGVPAGAQPQLIGLISGTLRRWQHTHACGARRGEGIGQ